jgi:hypothetical protein
LLYQYELDLLIYWEFNRETAPHMSKTTPDWLAPLTLITMIGLAFEAITGLLIYLAPFSIFNQYGVFLHTFIGIVWSLAFLWYAIRHWWKRFRSNFNHVQLLGYIAFGLILVCLITGVWLTIEATLGTRITYGWSIVHLYTGLVLIALTVAHLAVIWGRNPDGSLPAVKRRFVLATVAGATGILAIQIMMPVAFPAPEMNNSFPDDYTFPYGEDRPFAPSLGHTESNSAYDPASLAGSEGCGSSGCHEQILAEWAPSAHRYSSADLAFQEVQKLLYNDLGPEGTRYCAGCHDPIALFSGSKNVNVDGLTSPGAEEGVSCISCHAIVQTDVRGNADYTISQPLRYVGEQKPGTFNKWLGDFLIRAYPQQHVASFTKPLYKTAEYCGACHKQFIDEEVNQFGWVQLQNQYDNWKESRWHDEEDESKTITCRECHMPLVDSNDPAAGDSKDANRDANDGKHRSHRFLAANQVMPLLMELPGAEEHVELTEKWLQGKIRIPEIADRWVEGPVIRLELEGPETTRPGEEVEFQLVLTNNKTGHGFPTGPMDIIRSWVEITVKDDMGNLVYENGKPDADGQMNPEAVIFKAEGIDRDGNSIDRHNLWEMVGAQYKRVLFPGMADSARFQFLCPDALTVAANRTDVENRSFEISTPGAIKHLEITAQLKYQKADAEFMDRLFGEEAGLRTPITTITEQTLIIPVTDSQESRDNPASNEEEQPLALR